MEVVVKKQQGFLLIAAIILIVVIGVLAATIARIMTIQGKSTSDHINAAQAFYIANSGLNLAVYALQHGTSCSAIKRRRNFSQVTFAQGQFSVSATGYKANSTLSKAVSRGAKVIPLASIAGYAERGRVIIDNEWIGYRGLSKRASVCGAAPCLINISRGMGATRVVAHTKGSRVMQQQCHLVSVAAVPNLTRPRARRRVSENVYTLVSGEEDKRAIVAADWQ